MRIVFSSHAWEDYLFWQGSDKKMLQKINSLINEIKRQPFTGTGKPEPLRGNLTGYWSRRISIEHRLVYAIKDNDLWIVACRFHY